MNTPDQLIDLKADGFLTLLHFDAPEATKLTRKFVNELTAALTAGARKPLICSNDRQLLAVFKAAVAHIDLRNENGRRFHPGVKFSDAKSLHTIQFTTDDATIPEGGSWIDKRTPETVYRHELAVFDAPAMCRTLDDLVSRWETSGELVPPQSAEELQAAYRASQPTIPTVQEQALEYIDFDFESLDITNPMRQGPLIAEVRRLRAARAAEHAQAERVSKQAWHSRFFGAGG